MNAKEAREMAIKIKQARVERESKELLKTIVSNINYTASLGGFYVISRDMFVSTKKELKNLGYKVKWTIKRTPFTSKYWRVSWE